MNGLEHKITEPNENYQHIETSNLSKELLIKNIKKYILRDLFRIYQNNIRQSRSEIKQEVIVPCSRNSSLR